MPVIQQQPFKLERIDFPKGPTVVFVLGGPGSGKGTQCSKIVEAGDGKTYGFEHLSAGDLLRAEQKREGSAVGSLINEHISNGSIVPSEITISLIQKRILESMQERSIERFLIDGFPRSEEQAEEFEKNVCHPTFVVYFSVHDDTLTQRLLKRGETSGRVDDNMESIKKRLVTFHGQSMPVIERYQKQSKVKEIDAETGGIDEVWKRVQSHFEPYKQS